MLNVRLKFCTIPPLLKSLLKLPTDRHLLQQLEQCIRKLLSSEKEPDVCTAVREVLLCHHFFSVFRCFLFISYFSGLILCTRSHFWKATILETISRSYVPNGTMSNDDDDDDDDDGDDCGDDDADYDDNEYFSLNIEPTLKSVTVKKNSN